ncbi:DUF6456 domain-containing protein [Brucellaceae bacterium C25G]
MILKSEHGAICVARDLIVGLARDGYLQIGTDQKIKLSPEGIDYLVLHKNRRLSDIDITLNGETHTVKYNLAESPLGVLYRMKTASGQSFLTISEFNAGERLRSDFTRGSMMPRITSNWDANVQTHSRGLTHGTVDLSDGIMSARLRVERALDAVGPELSGSLVDICCFLKTISQVEAERKWPARSAKMLIKTGLSILHRHYHPVAQRSTPAHVVHWGTDNYRPAL